MTALPQSANDPIKTWFRDETEEESMHEDHAYLWRHILNVIPEKDFSHLRVLDYGCNRGGFLRLLHALRPFKQGFGVDIAQESLIRAKDRSRGLPVTFSTPSEIHSHASRLVDVAFSHEVLYLLPDLNEHAALIADLLTDSGVYYAVIGCHTDNQLWNKWRGLIAQSTHLPVFDYSLDEYARVFWSQGMRVEMRPFHLNDFALIKKQNEYFPKAIDSLTYHDSTKTILRVTRGA